MTTAADIRARGIALCKPDPGTKSPTYPEWGMRSLEAHDFRPHDLMGVICGPLSDCGNPACAHVIVDSDGAEAVARADEYLPPTGMMDERDGKPKDHRHYSVRLDSIPPWAISQAEQAAAAALMAKGHAGPFKKGFNHAVTGNRIIDFLGTGGQAVCPSPGGNRRWVGGAPGEPAVLEFVPLWDSVCRLALACGCKMPGVYSATESAPRVSTALPTESVMRRAVAYLDKCDPAVSQANGHGRTYWPARVVCWGFDLGAERGFQLLWDYFNPRCQPPWSEPELRHKCRDADRLPFSKPRGWLLNDDARPAPLRRRRVRIKTVGV